MQLMGYRYNELTSSLAAMDRGAGPFIGYNGSFYPVGNTDDLGSYYFIPQIARQFSLPLELAADVFYFGSIALSVFVGAIGLMLYLRSWTGRAVSLALLGLLADQVIRHGDVYLAAPCCIIACVPWAFWLAERANRTWILVGGAALIGMTIGTANLVRGHAGTGVLLMSLVLMGFAARHTLLRRAAFITALFAGMALPLLYQSYLLKQADAFLLKQSATYAGRTNSAHPMWHSIYIGLGYLKNQHNITYDDAVAAAAARKVDPNVVYMSQEYERILRKEVTQLYQRDPEFIYQTVSAKVGYVLFSFLRYAHFGLLAACLGVFGRRQLSAFALGSAFSSLPGVLVMPFPSYILGFSTFAAMFALMSLGKCGEYDWGLSRVWSKMAALRPKNWNFSVKRIAPALRFALVILGCTLAAKETLSAYDTAAHTVKTSYHDARRQAIKRLAESGEFPVSRKLEFRDLQWTTTAPKADVKHVDDQIALTSGGNQYDFQLEAKIPLTEDIVYATYDVEVLTGGFAIGIMDETGIWADMTYCPKPGTYQTKMAAYVPKHRDVRLIVWNYNPSSTAADMTSTCRIKNFTVTLGKDEPTTVAGKDSVVTLKR